LVLVSIQSVTRQHDPVLAGVVAGRGVHHVASETRYTRRNPRSIRLGLVVLLAAASPAFAFPDVPAGHAYEQAINGLAGVPQLIPLLAHV